MSRGRYFSLEEAQQEDKVEQFANAFSKKLENHIHMLSLYFVHYNFCRIHKSLRVTPAMEAGISKTLWEISDIVALLPEEAPKKRGSYKKKTV